MSINFDSITAVTFFIIFLAWIAALAKRK